jgi:hypothetical protein
MQALSKKFHLFHEGTPGRRFRDQYQRNHRSKAAKSLFKKILRWIGAVAAFSVGVVLSVIPGPAIPFFLLAGGLLATDWLWMAKLLDWIEVRARRLWAHLHKYWQTLSLPGRIFFILLGGCFSALTTYTFYQVIH